MKNGLPYFSGTSGLVLPYPNKQFYPSEFKDKSRLHYYGSLFNSIEINSSFYKTPLASTVARWASDVPEDFRFTFKLSRQVTHNTDLRYNPPELDRFMHHIARVETKQGCLLVQFPPRLTFSQHHRLRKLLDNIRSSDSGQSWSVSVEFRDRSWYKEETYELLNDYRMGLVIHDKTGSATPVVELGTDVIYLRFHGPDGDYKGSYPEPVLREYAGYILEWIKNGKTVYVYFNNTMGEAIQNLNTLNHLIEKRAND